MKDSKGAMAAKEDHPNADLLVGYPTAASSTTSTTWAFKDSFVHKN